jgi:hypothetical protein
VIVSRRKDVSVLVKRHTVIVEGITIVIVLVVGEKSRKTAVLTFLVELSRFENSRNIEVTIAAAA